MTIYCQFLDVPTTQKHKTLSRRTRALTFFILTVAYNPLIPGHYQSLGGFEAP